MPAAYNDQKDGRNLRAHYGRAVCRWTFTLPRSMAGERVVLRFGAVTCAAEVYLNGRLPGTHKGGFLPFEFEISGVPVPGESRLTVAVDNRVNFSALPVDSEGGITFFGSDNPGIPSIELAKTRCKPQDRPSFDFFNYAGIIRPVRLCTTSESHIEDISIVTGMDGVVSYCVETAGQGSVAAAVLHEDGADTCPGIHNTNPEMFSEEYQVDYYARINAELDQRPFVVGEQVWSFADFATIQGPMRVDGNRKGLLTRDRRPKLAARFFRRRWHDIPDFNCKP